MDSRIGVCIDLKTQVVVKTNLLLAKETKRDPVASASVSRPRVKPIELYRDLEQPLLAVSNVSVLFVKRFIQGLRRSEREGGTSTNTGQRCYSPCSDGGCFRWLKRVCTHLQCQ